MSAETNNFSIDIGKDKARLPEKESMEMGKNETVTMSNASYIWTSQLNPNAITTGFYILAGLCSLILAYFVYRAIRLKRRNYKVRRYGVIASREDVEMTPLENEDDDEDSTVFDISVKTHSRS